MRNFTLKLASAALGATALLSGAALADYPEKPVSFIVPWPPGDVEDVLTRLIAEEFQTTYGVPAAVVNKPGGGGGPFPGAISVATAPADGYTVGSFVIGVPVTGPEIGIPELNPNPFDPLGIFMTYPFVIAAAKNDNYSTMEELAAYAKDNEVTLGHFGSFLPPTRVTFALAKNLGFDFAAETAFDNLDCNVLASGDVDVINTTIQQISACRDDLVILASIGGQRTSQTPDVPTVSEIEPSIKVALWNGLFVHKDTPAEAREKIIAVAQKALQSDAAKAVSDRTGTLIYWQDAEASKAQIESDIDSLKAIDKLLGE